MNGPAVRPVGMQITVRRGLCRHATGDRHRGARHDRAAAPGRLQHARTRHTLDGHHAVHTAQHGPAQPSHAVHELPTAQPAIRLHGGTITAELHGLDLEGQQSQPVAQPPVTHAPAHIGQVHATLGTPLHAQQTGRIESAHHDAAFRHQHPGRLAQHGMRVRRGLQRMGHHDQVEAGLGKWQRGGIGQQRHGNLQRGGAVRWRRILRGIQRQPAVRHAVGTQPLEHGHAQLQAVIAENIGHRLVAALLLPFQQVVAEGRLRPVMHPYNFAAHEPVAHSCFFRQLHLAAA